eukprot:gnl/Spiro4/26930_TR13396_c0_g1_i1.p1 gnl/Spiro4/26930_TR13396_c0_g1~~gnl/Spiro4/26930_TR13396_c0_g1_i1.p1  ORF type:complete len:815 (-),score=193.80 gnl/Spiro4/26930_TR13396_c0_g1_i1:118-2562(-)
MGGYCFCGYSEEELEARKRFNYMKKKKNHIDTMSESFCFNVRIAYNILFEKSRRSAKAAAHRRELIWYLVFVTILLCCVFNSRSITGVSYMHQNIRKAFTVENFNQTQVSSYVYRGFETVSDVADIYKWLLWPFYRRLFESNGTVGTYNRAFGRIRFRQYRVVSGCAIDRQAQIHLNASCYDFYSEFTKATAPFGPASNTSKYQYTPDTGTLLGYWGEFTWFYGSGAYVSDIPLDPQVYYQTVSSMQADNWIDVATRLVKVNLFFANANLGNVMLAEFAFEISPGMSVRASDNLYSFNLTQYYWSAQYVLAVFELIFSLMVFAHIFWFIKQVRGYPAEQKLVNLVLSQSSLEKKGRKHSHERTKISMLDFFDGWHILEVVNLAAFVALIIMRFVYLARVSSVKPADLLADKYINYETLAYSYNIELNLLGLNILLTLLRIFKYFQLSPQLYALWSTISRAMPELAAFVIIFFIVFMGFTLMGYVLFGERAELYRNLTQAISTNFGILLGQRVFEQIYPINRLVAPLYFVSYVVIVFLVLINVFLAIITDAYREIEDERKEEEKGDEFRATDRSFASLVHRHVAKPFRNFLRWMRLPEYCVTPKGPKIKLPDHETVYNCLRKSAFHGDSGIPLGLDDIKLILGEGTSDQIAWEIMCRYDPSKIIEFQKAQIEQTFDQLVREKGETEHLKANQLIALATRLSAMHHTRRENDQATAGEKEAHPTRATIDAKTAWAHVLSHTASTEDFVHHIQFQLDKIGHLSKVLDNMAMRVEAAIVAQRRQQKRANASIAIDRDFCDSDMEQDETVPSSYRSTRL